MSIFKTNRYQLNTKHLTDGLQLLSDIKDESIKTAFFDPQYRGVLDKLKYGNEGQARGKARSSLPQMEEDTPDVEAAGQLKSEDEIRMFIIAFRSMAQTLATLKTFSKFDWQDLEVVLGENEYEGYKSWYLYFKDQISEPNPKVPVPVDVDFEIELVRTDRINVVYILNLLKKAKAAGKSEEERQKDVDLILREIERSDNEGLRLKKEVMKNFILTRFYELPDDVDVMEAFSQYEKEQLQAEMEEFSFANEIEYVVVSDLFSEFVFTKHISDDDKPKEGILDLDYIVRYLITDKGKQLLELASPGGAGRNKTLGQKEFANSKLFIPCYEEQKKIADILVDVDAVITACEDKIAILEIQKKAVRKKLFLQEVRFKGDDGTDFPEWEEHPLSYYLEIRDEKQVPTAETPLMAFIAYRGVVDKGDRYDRSFLIKTEDKKYKRTEYNDFIYSSNNLDVGSIGLNKYGSAVISVVYEIFKVKNTAVPECINEIIQAPTNMAKILQYRQGALYGQYKIHASDFLSVSVSVPCLEEQRLIADFLSDFDEVIAAAKKKAELWKTLKKGLLQQMFI